VTPPDDLIRESLRDLIPAYSGPVDPYARVGATIVRRRRTQRRLITVSAMAAVVAVAIGVPAVLRVSGPAAVTPGAATGGGPAPGASPGVAGPVPLPAGQVIATGTVGGARWSVTEGPMSTDAHRCLHADDAVFRGAAVCFDDWTPRRLVGWHRMVALQPGVAASAYFGVAPRGATRVKLVLSDGSTQQAYPVPVPGEPDAAFFAVVAARPGLGVLSVAAFDAANTPLQPPASDPRATGCEPATATC
jgi:hypothetical protein